MLFQNCGITTPGTTKRFVRTFDGSLLTTDQMTLHLLSSAIFAATVRTGDWKFWTHNLMALQCVGRKVSAAIFTVEDSFTASVDHVCLQPVPGDPLAALILTIQWFKATNILMHVNIHGG